MYSAMSGLCNEKFVGPPGIGVEQRGASPPSSPDLWPVGLVEGGGLCVRMAWYRLVRRIVCEDAPGICRLRSTRVRGSIFSMALVQELC